MKSKTLTAHEMIMDEAGRTDARVIPAAKVLLSLTVTEILNATCAGMQLRLEPDRIGGVRTVEVREITCLSQDDRSARIVGVLGELRAGNPSEANNWSGETWKPLAVVTVAYAAPSEWALREEE